MRKLIIALGLMTSALVVKAQQTPQYTQYMVNPYLYNPALAGSEDFVDIKAGYRAQWVGLENAPKTMYLSAHAPIKAHTLRHAKNDQKAYPGVGGYVMKDETGPISNLRFNGSFSYNLQISNGKWYGALHHSDGVRLTLGMSLGVNQYQIDGSKLKLEDSNDPSIAEGQMTKLNPDASVGAWLYFGDKFYVGASANQILNSKIKFNDAINEDAQNLGRLTPHYNLVAGTKLEVGYELYLLPSFMVKGVSGAPISWDLNTRIDYQDTYYGGISYRHQDAIALLAGVVLGKKKNIEVAYSYDITVSNIAPYSNGSHEVTLGYRIMPHLVSRNPSDNWGKRKRR
jgi:type IX secretion system PorP/SprF family membrane protein